MTIARRRRLPPSILAPLAIGLAAGTAAGDCHQTARRAESVSARGVSRVVVEAGAGSLEIRGTPGLDAIRASGRACADDERTLALVQIAVERKGNEVRITAQTPDHSSNLGGGSAHLDLVLELPREADVVVDDGSGSIVLEGVRSVELDDGSGSITINDVDQDVTIDDGSGSIEVRRVGGDLRIDDGSGSITVADAGGTVRLKDGSGGLEVHDVARDVIVDEDGSGDIEIRGVGGSVVIARDGSGSISVSDVRGDFRVDRDGSGDIHYANVDGAVRLP